MTKINWKILYAPIATATSALMISGAVKAEHSVTLAAIFVAMVAALGYGLHRLTRANRNHEWGNALAVSAGLLVFVIFIGLQFVL